MLVPTIASSLVMLLHRRHFLCRVRRSVIVAGLRRVFVSDRFKE
jgi:hypothetical protein